MLYKLIRLLFAESMVAWLKMLSMSNKFILTVACTPYKCSQVIFLFIFDLVAERTHVVAYCISISYNLKQLGVIGCRINFSSYSIAAMKLIRSLRKFNFIYLNGLHFVVHM